MIRKKDKRTASPGRAHAKLLSVLVSAVLVLSCLPLQALATGDGAQAGGNGAQALSDVQDKPQQAEGAGQQDGQQGQDASSGAADAGSSAGDAGSAAETGQDDGAADASGREGADAAQGGSADGTGSSDQEGTAGSEKGQSAAKQSARGKDMGKDKDKDGQGSQGEWATNSTTVDHIDIGVKATATISVDGRTYSKDITLQRSDFASGKTTITATQKGSSRSFIADYKSITTSTGASGVSQYRISGSYPTGTVKSPVTYTFKLTKDVAFTVDGQQMTVPVAFEAHFTYFDADNDCPSLSKKKDKHYQDGWVANGSGMDFTLGTGTGTASMVNISKTVCDLTTGERIGAQGLSFTFSVKQGGTTVKDLSVTVGSDGIGYATAKVSNAAVTITEAQPAPTIVAGGVTYAYAKTTIAAGDSQAKEGLTSDAMQPGGTFHVVNYYRPVTTEVAVEKAWDDADDQDGKRPDSVTVRLLADGQDTGRTLALDASGDWKGAFTGLAAYKDGRQIAYTVSEDRVDGYDEPAVTGDAANGFTITNKRTPETVEVSGTKTWDDEAYRDGDGFISGYSRPDSVTVNLTGTVGGETVFVDSQDVTEADGWAYRWTGLAKYDAGREITYTVTEDDVDGFEATVDGWNVANAPVEGDDVLVPASITVKKTDASTGHALTGAAFTLTNDATGDSVTAEVGDEGTLTFEFSGSGSFTLEEAVAPQGYVKSSAKYAITVSKSGAVEVRYDKENKAWQWVYNLVIDSPDLKDGVLVVGNGAQETSVAVSKEWDDAGDQDGKRPDSVTVRLLADGRDTGRTLAIDAACGWSGSFEGLPAYRDGEPIEYTVSEDAVEGYEASIEGSAEDGFTVTNAHEPETVDIAGTKTWDDDGDSAGKRPDSITVLLYAADGDGADVVAETTATAEGGWAYSFTGLPKYLGGKEITYTIGEEAVEGYTCTVDGYDMTNAYEPDGGEVVPPEGDDGDGDGAKGKDGTAKSSAANVKSRSAKTGDVAGLGAVAAVAAASLAAAACASARRGKGRHSRR